MQLTNSDIAAMAKWTLEDIQNDPLGAVVQIRELAAERIALSKDRAIAKHLGGGVHTNGGKADCLAREYVSCTTFTKCFQCGFNLYEAYRRTKLPLVEGDDGLRRKYVGVHDRERSEH